MFFWCAASIASAICRAYSRSRAIGSEPARDSPCKRVALDEGQHERPPAQSLSGRSLNAEDRPDVGMIERGQEAGLPLEAGEPAGVAGKGRRRTLMATSRPSCVSRARYTSPMPPNDALAHQIGAQPTAGEGLAGDVHSSPRDHRRGDWSLSSGGEVGWSSRDSTSRSSAASVPQASARNAPRSFHGTRPG